jgi:phenylpropionate dioxygenase-like ring-hydroxylating dioxygenase large terminal subunit
MGMIDHWHPVLRSEQLRRKPVGVKVAGQEVVVFRTGSGAVAALDEICPHRRFRLSLGEVQGERLQCRYHGWTFDACGRGESPGTPKLHACAASYDARESHGAIWVKPSGVEAEFPKFDVDDYYGMCVLDHRVSAPLELVVDNFCEIEHTPTTHGMFGYALDRMHEVKVRFEPTDTTVRVINSGPSKPLPWWLRTAMFSGKDDHFIDDWTTHFSPVYSVYDHWWENPKTAKKSEIRWRLYIFFTPVSEAETALMTFAYMWTSYPGPNGCTRPFRGYMRRMLDREIQLDVRVLQGLASHETSIDGMKLSRFDRVLGLNRERIERVYRGRSDHGNAILPMVRSLDG